MMVNDIKELQALARLSSERAAGVFEVSRKTWDRWRGGQTRPPAAVLAYLKTLAGRLPYAGWEGWEIVGGLLYPPTFRDGLDPQTVAGVHYLRQELEFHRQRAKVPAQYLLDL